MVAVMEVVVVVSRAVSMLSDCNRCDDGTQAVNASGISSFSVRGLIRVWLVRGSASYWYNHRRAHYY